MSTSSAVPVLRTVDLSAAYRAALRLLDLVEPLEKFHVNAEAQARTLKEAQRLVAALPDAVVSPDDPRRPETSDEIKRMVVDGPGDVEPLFPLTLILDQRPVGSIEKALLGVLDASPASIDWDWFRWPPVPELGLASRGKDAGLQIAINCRDVLRDVPAGDHTVFVHIRSGDLERAQWLAAQAGLQIIGPAQSGW